MPSADTPSLAYYLERAFPHTPNAGQAEAFRQLSDFLADGQRQALLLKGYAGTGKTTLVSALVGTLRYVNYKAMLLAPTGRSAKVMAVYAKRRAFTVHRIIYQAVEDPITGRVNYALRPNTSKRTLYVVDEASMINDRSDSGRSLLADLLAYAFADTESGNKLLLIGDTAQLPPVHQLSSPALEPEYLERYYRLPAEESVLTQVMRQGEYSGILSNATDLRDRLTRDEETVQFSTKGYKDIYRMTSERLEDGLRYAYDKYGTEKTVVITRSNKQAVMYNRYIRQKILFRESELDAGDLLMVARNNYQWLPKDSPAGFLANGEFVEVNKVMNYEEMYGRRFASIEFSLVDYPDHVKVEAKTHLDTLYEPSAQIPQDESKQFYERILEDFKDIADKRERWQMIAQDGYLHALQIKFAYALTCHKAQGGQWEAVFVDMGFLPNGTPDREFIRWLYTAVTRAKSELFLVNFPDSFF